MDFWKWVTLIGVVASVIAILAIPDLIYRKPKIDAIFDIDDREGERYLTCKIWNKPITKGLPKWLSVERHSAQVSALFRIEVKGTGEPIIIANKLVQIKTQEGKESKQIITLKAGFIPASFFIIEVNKAGKSVCAPNDTCMQLLKPNEYTVKVEIYWDAMKPKKLQRNCIVTNNYPFAYWLTKS